MIRLLIRLWFVVVPLVLYGAWMLWHRRQARLRGANVPAFHEGPWGWAVVASLLLAIAGLVWWGASSSPNQGQYQPPHLENGAIVPGKVQ